MIRVLQSVNNMQRAGLETMLMNYYRRIDRHRIQFDFLTHRPYRSEYDDEIEDLGGKVFYAPRLFPQNYPVYFRYMKSFYAEHPEYRIIHSHIDSMSYLPLLAAKRSGVPVRIAHSHNTSLDKDFKYPMKEYFRHRVPYVATDYLACGTEAGRFLFGDRDFLVIPNAVDVSRFRFEEKTRSRIRRSLGIEDQFVIGAVGRLTRQKNLSYLIRVFGEIIKTAPDTKLLIIGDGEEEKSLKELAYNIGVERNTFFLGVRSDVSSLYSAMDVLVMPSLYEGMPVVGVEAQFSGLHCVFSSRITKEIRLSKKAYFLSIERPASEWAEFILRLRGKNEDRSSALQYNAYNIDYAKDILEQFYLKKLDELEHN